MQKSTSLYISTQNGTGSLSANQILLTALFKSGYFTSSKNLFPSNIAGLATQYFIRWSNVEHLCSFQIKSDYLLNIHLPLLNEDLLKIKDNGTLIIDAAYSEILPSFPNYFLIAKKNIQILSIPYKELLLNIKTKAPIKKLLKNIISISFLSEMFNIDISVINAVLEERFQGKILDLNKISFDMGRREAQKYIQEKKIKPIIHPENLKNNNNHSLLTDGNTSAALGVVTAGCQFFSWYPITPSTSMAENIKKLQNQLALNKKTHLVTQSEDELSAISMAIGASWTGARAATATSGPGLSLMAEALGYAYFAEIPLVVCDVQRMGPSTGLPTKTSQGDLSFALQLSHGDCQSIILLPSNPTECFEMHYQAFDIANHLQTPILILSDLDLGMNTQSCPEFSYPSSELNFGKLSHIQEKKLNNWQRYADPDKDFIPIRSLPGSLDPYFTRGTGHDQKGNYSENPENYQKLLTRLHSKTNTAINLTPPPIIITPKPNNKPCIQIIAYGSTDQIIQEVCENLNSKYFVEYLKIRSCPLHKDIIKSFLKADTTPCFIIEQNASGQMKNLITQTLPEHYKNFISITHYNGLPIDSHNITQKIISKLN